MLRKLVTALCVGAGLGLMPPTLARAEELTTRMVTPTTWSWVIPSG